jgi:hypothetical protein
MTQKKPITFESLIEQKLPTSKVTVCGVEFELRAQSSRTLDDLITKYPPEKDSSESFGDGLRFELVALSVTNVELTTEQAKELLETWARPDVVKLQSAVFELNWLGSEAKQVPLSGTGSEETPGTP